MDKYVRRDFSEHSDVYNISYIQFAKRYIPTNTEPRNSEDFRPKEFVKGNEDPEQLTKIDFIVEHDFEVKTMVKFLPKYIKINDVLPGEPRFMKLRKPCVARLHKYNKIKNPHEFYYSELQLYKPFHCEEMLSPNSLDKCEELYEEKSEHNSKRKISNVKKHFDGIFRDC